MIGADGIHSVVRAAIVGDESPEFTGLAAYRALVPADEAPEFARRPVCSIWLGPRRHFVHYPVSGGRAGQPRDREPGGRLARGVLDGARRGRGLPGRVRGLGRRASALIAAARETRRYAFYAREPVTRWVAGRVALLGDAAHPMLPFFAQGAGQAIEDGAVLAGCLARGVPTCRRRCGATSRCASSARPACSG